MFSERESNSTMQTTSLPAGVFQPPPSYEASCGDSNLNQASTERNNGVTVAVNRSENRSRTTSQNSQNSSEVSSRHRSRSISSDNHYSSNRPNRHVQNSGSEPTSRDAVAVTSVTASGDLEDSLPPSYEEAVSEQSQGHINRAFSIET